MHRIILPAKLVVIDILRRLALISHDKASYAEPDTAKLYNIANLTVHLVVELRIELVMIVPDDVPRHLQVMLVAITLDRPVVKQPVLPVLMDH